MDAMSKCKVCRDEFDADQVTDGVCRWCAANARFAAFAKECGLTRFPDPTGERYVYQVTPDGWANAGKKSENADFVDELWAALVRAKGGDAALIPGEG